MDRLPRKLKKRLRKLPSSMVSPLNGNAYDYQCPRCFMPLPEAEYQSNYYRVLGKEYPIMRGGSFCPYTRHTWEETHRCKVCLAFTSFYNGA